MIQTYSVYIKSINFQNLKAIVKTKKCQAFCLKCQDKFILDTFFFISMVTKLK